MRESLDFCEKLFNAEAECFPFEYELVPIQTDNNKEKQDDSITKSEINPVPEDEPKVSKASLIASKLKKKPEGAEDAKTKEAEKKEISADRPDVESIRDKLKRGMEETEKSRETDAQVKEEKSSKLDSIRNKLSKKAHESSIAKPVPMDIVEPTKRRKYEYELTEELRSLLVKTSFTSLTLTRNFTDFSQSQKFPNKKISFQLHQRSLPKIQGPLGKEHCSKFFPRHVFQEVSNFAF